MSDIQHTTASHVPETEQPRPGSVVITPKLVVSDADAALDFYARAFGATTTQRFTQGDQVVFAQMDIAGQAVQVKDADDVDPSPATLGRPGVLLDVAVEDPDAVVGRAVAAGATVVFPVADQTYGARGGRIRDPFGHEWLVQTPRSTDSKAGDR